MSFQLITSDIQTLPMQSCSKYESCSAPICPLDTNWKLRKHIKDDPVCFYLREVAKREHQGEPISGGRSDPMLVAAADVWDKRTYLAAPLRNQLLRASKSSSKGFRDSDEERLAA
jgi:hypothetical protein